MRSSPRSARTLRYSLVLSMALISCVTSSAFLRAPASAAPVSVGGGFEYYSGPGNQITHTAQGTVAMGAGPVGSLALTAVRFDDSNVGEGNAVAASLGMPLAALATLRVTGMRFIGDEAYRAWRIKGGPEFGLPASARLGLFYTHFEDEADFRSDAVVGEASMPIAGGLTGRANASYAWAPNDLSSQQAAIGLGWSAVRFLEIYGEGGIAVNGALASSPIPSGSLLPLPILGEPDASGPPHKESKTEGTATVGFRLMFP
jgi:hypothetical protein